MTISEKTLATTDEPLLVFGILRERPAAEIKALAEGGDRLATYILGYMYEFGVGVPMDLAKAREWLEAAAKQGTPWGQLELGYFLLTHSQGPADLTRAIDLYRAAAAQGYAKAQGHLAAIYLEGAFVPHSPDNRQHGLELMVPAAQGGYPFAMFVLADVGPPAGQAAWQANLRRLADSGDSEGSKWLCELETKRGESKAAFRDCTDAANAGDSNAQAHLAIAYHVGAVATKSEADAMHWTRLALAQKDLRSDLRQALLALGYVLHAPAAKRVAAQA